MAAIAATAATAAIAVTAVLVGACGGGRDERGGGERPEGSAAAAPAGSAGSSAAGAADGARLRPIAELREQAVLVEGTRRIAVWIGRAGWYEPDARGLAAQPLIGRAIGRAAEELGPLAEPFLGTSPILAGGEDHREQHLRFTPALQAVKLDGLLVQVATSGRGGAGDASGTAEVEVWRFEHELRTELAVVGAGGELAPLPAFSRIGPDTAARSPVSAKACATPKVRAIAGGAGAIHALVTECHPDTPVRIATYQWRQGSTAPPERAVREIGSLAALDVEIEHLLATRQGTAIVVGRRADTVAVMRVDAAGRIATTLGPRGVESVTHAAVADDGAVWVRTLGRGPGGRDAIAVARDGTVVTVTGPGRTPLRAESLAFDEQLGIVVLARDGATGWLLAERAPAGAVLVLP